MSGARRDDDVDVVVIMMRAKRHTAYMRWIFFIFNISPPAIRHIISLLRMPYA